LRIVASIHRRQRGEAVSGRLGEDEIDVARFSSGRGQERLDVIERDVRYASDADQLALRSAICLMVGLAKTA